MSVVRRFEEAFNANDVDALVQCFSPDATYTDTFFGPHTGHPALRAMFQRMFHEGYQYEWRMDAVVEDARHAAAEWSFRYIVTDAIPRSAGRKVRFRGMSLFVLEGERIQTYREYFDKGAALLQIGFEAEPLAKVLRRGLPEGA